MKQILVIALLFVACLSEDYKKTENENSTSVSNDTATASTIVVLQDVPAISVGDELANTMAYTHPDLDTNTLATTGTSETNNDSSTHTANTPSEGVSVEDIFEPKINGNNNETETFGPRFYFGLFAGLDLGILLFDNSPSETNDITDIGCTIQLPSDSQKSELVNFLNSVRRHVAKGEEISGYLPPARNMELMGYSTALEKVALRWVSLCDVNKNSDYDSDTYTTVWRKFLLLGSPYAIPPFDFVEKVKDQYYSNVMNFYGPDAIRPFRGVNSKTNADVRAFAMMINHDTRSIGCAQSSYANTTDSKYYRLGVCIYGNAYQYGAPLYDYGQPCAAVPPYQCDNGLIVVGSSKDVFLNSEENYG